MKKLFILALVACSFQVQAINFVNPETQVFENPRVRLTAEPTYVQNGTVSIKQEPSNNEIASLNDCMNQKKSIKGRAFNERIALAQCRSLSGLAEVNNNNE